MTSPPYLMQISSQIHYGARQMSRSRAKPGPLTLTAHLFYCRFSLTQWEAHYLQVLSLTQTHTPLSPSKTEIRHLTLLQRDWHWMLEIVKFKPTFLEVKKIKIAFNADSLASFALVWCSWNVIAHTGPPWHCSQAPETRFCCKLTWFSNCGIDTAIPVVEVKKVQHLKQEEQAS